ncbi:enoyl-CoA hydratase/isomerase family protein [Chryseobacterium turcicum]|uniref:Enoyl-CoA hydratase/isomerase family protein n=1 Tax=Chryseobacterium turcicum TaxID=2898076 RepID=A0A9Q3YW54_9FLAO|nr:enoyl-CoA hydratase/isomerase family protein [Chryseobacterium turcicum]MCD1117613.1 enoyl-CoA hydratase/isomerase family protein [Chryseobacterium turcicum]
MKSIKLAAILLIATVFSINSYAQTKAKSTISVEKVSPEIRKIHFSNAPINVIVPETLTDLNEVIKTLSKDSAVKVVIFQSDVKGYFFNHFDLTQMAGFAGSVTTEGKPMFVDLLTNITNAPFITIANIKGRTQGGGDELSLAFDLRYASKELAVFEQPEVGVGLFPGGGGTNLLPRLIGRDRAFEVFASGNDYDATIAEKFGLVTRTLPNAELDAFVDNLANRLATFDKTALVTVKQQLNLVAAPTEAERLASYSEFLKSLSWAGLQTRVPVFGAMYGEIGVEKLEQNMGFYVGEGNKRIQESKKNQKK